jgi:hypothetical protein
MHAQAWGGGGGALDHHTGGSIGVARARGGALDRHELKAVLGHGQDGRVTSG